MKTILLNLCICLAFQIACAQQNEDFEPLFNGKSLKGWTASTDKPESFFVQDGNLVVKGGRAHLFYTGKVGKADFKNFELKLKVKTTAGSNSGVYFHTKYQEDGWPKVGFEAQVNSTHSDPKKTGSLYGIVNIWAPKQAKEQFVARVAKNQEIYILKNRAPSIDDQWFNYHIIVKDNKITVKVDGMTTVEWTQPDNWEKERRIGHGTIGLQAHDPKCEVHYKDIEIKILD